MGLTVYFKLTAPAGLNEAGAKNIVASLLRAAVRFEREGLVDAAHLITTDPKTLRRVACDWLTLPVPGGKNTFTSLEILPVSGFIFRVDIGRDCEPLWLGLCRYPPTVDFGGKKLRTKKGAGWQFAGFSKTQYASLHGWEYFRRCHCAVVDLLADTQSYGLRVKINDEGEYWPRRSLSNLRRNLDEMNGLVAAAAGAWKDMGETEGKANGVQSPIFAHKHFERLEAEGAAAVAPVLKKLRDAIK